MKRAPSITVVFLIALVMGAFAVSGSRLASATPSRLPASWAEAQASSHPNALWHVVHDLCVRDMRASGLAAPCASVDLAGRYAVVKDIERPTQYLLVPTDRITGIESPALLAAKSPNYWRAAWGLRSRSARQLGRALPREDFGLAVNSIDGRSQNQLHIHADCVRPSVRDALRDHNGQIGARWSTLTIGPAQNRYRVRWIDGADLGVHDPFKILARTDPAARADMGRYALALVGASRPSGAPGFVLLASRSQGTEDDNGHSEDLLDHHCRAFNPAG